MLHALFDIYMCDCDHGCWEKTERRYHSHHHIPWQRAAYAIELADRFNSVGMGLSMDLSRHSSMAYDVQLGYNLPNESTLRSLDLDITKILEHLRYQRERANVINRHDNSLNLFTQLPLGGKKGCIRDEWIVDKFEGKFGRVTGH